MWHRSTITVQTHHQMIIQHSSNARYLLPKCPRLSAISGSHSPCGSLLDPGSSWPVCTCSGHSVGCQCFLYVDVVCSFWSTRQLLHWFLTIWWLLIVKKKQAFYYPHVLPSLSSFSTQHCLGVPMDTGVKVHLALKLQLCVSSHYLFLITKP